MYKKTWRATWSGNVVVVENAWDFADNTKEIVRINNEIVWSRCHSLDNVEITGLKELFRC